MLAYRADRVKNKVSQEDAANWREETILLSKPVTIRGWAVYKLISGAGTPGPTPAILI